MSLLIPYLEIRTSIAQHTNATAVTFGGSKLFGDPIPIRANRV